VGECVCMRERDGVFLCLCFYVLVHVFEGGGWTDGYIIEGGCT